MLRKRLIGLLATILLGLNAAPAAALATDEQPAQVTAIEAAQEGGRLLEFTGALDPEVDLEIPGLGRVTVDLDEDEMSLTVGVRVDPAGIDETVTVGGSSQGGTDEEAADDEAGTDAPTDAPTAAEQAAAAEKAAMDAAKAEAAAAAAADRPAFTEGATRARGASGNAGAGTGVASSTRPSTSTPDLGNPTAATPFVDEGQNPWLRLMGAVMLAGTGTAWSMAKKYGLA